MALSWRRKGPTRSKGRRSEAIYTPQIEPGHSGHIYVVGFAGYVKIGWSRKVNERLLDVQEGLPENLIVHALISGTCEMERDLHRVFADLRLEGEWFRLTGELARWIRQRCPMTVLEESHQESQATLSNVARGAA